jgi:uncharacterized protein (DUF1800 family)
MSIPLPSDINRVDPRQAWEPWIPDDRQPWNARWAGHLFRRASFAASPEEVDRAIKDGFAPTLNRLLKGEERHTDFTPVLADLGEQFAREGAIETVRAWWVYVMMHSGHPLREKLTLFWHNHFATSVRKVKSAHLMYRQNQLFRTHALGKFRPFLREVGRDVAMLLWLDSDRNLKGKPNENYARELLELFTLGVGNYTERDVQEAARAFTGWHADPGRTRFSLDADNHDAGLKTVLGRQGNWDGDDIAGIVLDHPAAARFLAGKLYRELISEESPPPALLEPLIQRFRESDYDIGDLTVTLLRSRLFFSSHAFLRKIKTPVEFVLGAVHAAWSGPIRPDELAEAIGDMGQTLFAPPNVKGWPGGRAWLNTQTLLRRNNFAESVAMGKGTPPPTERVPGVPPLPLLPPVAGGAVEAEAPKKDEPEDPPAPFDVVRRLGQLDEADPGDLARRLLNRFLPGLAPKEARKQLRAFLAEGKPQGIHLRSRLREAAHAVMCVAEFQLC